MIEFRKGEIGELGQITEFINQVFSGLGQPHNFPSLLPKLYAPGKHTEPCHYMVLEENDIKGVVCSYPVSCHFGSMSLTCATVGSVSVHSDSRGKGYMKKLMSWAVQDMIKDGISFSCLTGSRQRYAYFGYEPGGIRCTYRLYADNFRHSRHMFPSYELSLNVEFDWKSLRALYLAQPCYVSRSLEDFSDICGSWGGRAYAISYKEAVVGYVIIKLQSVWELVLKEEDMLFSALEACCKLVGVGKELLYRVYPHEYGRMDILSGFAERWFEEIDDNYQIFDYENVLLFYLKLKAVRERLWDGICRMTIGNCGTFVIRVSHGVPNVYRENTGAGDVILTDSQAMELIFTPMPSRTRWEFHQEYRVNWFPLPLSLCCLDKC